MVTSLKGRLCALVAVALVSLVVVAPPAPAAVIATVGTPLPKIYVQRDLKCQVVRQGWTHPAFYHVGTDPYNGACGTFVGVKPNLLTYGPRIPPMPASPFSPVVVPYTLIGQSGVTNGANGRCVITTVQAGPLRVRQRDCYVAPNRFYTTRIALTNTSSSPVGAILFRAADCYARNSDSGWGHFTATPRGIYCTRAPNDITTPGSFEGFVAMSSGAAYFEGKYWTVWARVNRTPFFTNTCLPPCDTTAHDNGAGLSWRVPLETNQTRTHVLRTVF